MFHWGWAEYFTPHFLKAHDHLSWPVVLHVIWGLLWLLHLLPPLLFSAWVSSWTLICTADWLKFLSSWKVGLTVGHGHAGVCRAVLMEGVGVSWRCEGKWAVASALTWRIQDVLIAAGDLAAELDTTRQDWWRLIGKDSSWQALCAAQSTWVHRRLPFKRGTEGWAHWGAVLGAIGWDWRELRDFSLGAAWREEKIGKSTPRMKMLLVLPLVISTCCNRLYLCIRIFFLGILMLKMDVRVSSYHSGCYSLSRAFAIHGAHAFLCAWRGSVPLSSKEGQSSARGTVFLRGGGRAMWALGHLETEVLLSSPFRQLRGQARRVRVRLQSYNSP